MVDQSLMFINNYNKYSKIKINDNIKSQFNIEDIHVGQGGSIDAIIIVTHKKTKEMFAIKLMVDNEYAIQTQTHVKELKFNIFMTERFLLTMKTPHIAGLYSYSRHNDVKKLLFSINNKYNECPSIDQLLLGKKYEQDINIKICELIEEQKYNIIDDKCVTMLMEYCNPYLDKILIYHMKLLHKSQEEVDLFLRVIDRIIFQLVFTLAIIKNKYPGFIHGALSMSNVMFIDVKDNRNTYVAYHYGEKTYYFPHDGVYIKIGDFGHSIIAGQLENKKVAIEDNWRNYYGIDPQSEKMDIFRFLKDFYIGQYSLLFIASRLRTPDVTLDQIKKCMSKYIDVKTIEHYTKTCPYIIKNVSNVDKSKILQKTIKTPHQYLAGKTFDVYTKLPKDVRIILEFNK
jgi:hypothetical protein